MTEYVAVAHMPVDHDSINLLNRFIPVLMDPLRLRLKLRLRVREEREREGGGLLQKKEFGTKETNGSLYF